MEANYTQFIAVNLKVFGVINPVKKFELKPKAPLPLIRLLKQTAMNNRLTDG